MRECNALDMIAATHDIVLIRGNLWKDPATC